MAKRIMVSPCGAKRLCSLTSMWLFYLNWYLLPTIFPERFPFFTKFGDIHVITTKVLPSSSTLAHSKEILSVMVVGPYCTTTTTVWIGMNPKKVIKFMASF